MKNRGFQILGGATLLLGIAIALTHFAEKESTGRIGSQGELLGDIRVEEIGKIRIEKGDESTTLIRHDKGYRLEEKGGYEGDIAKIERFVLKLHDLKGTEWITSNSRKYETLGVDDNGKETFKVSILSGSGSDLGGLIIGKKRKTGAQERFDDSRYVRAAGKKDVFLAGNMADVESDPSAWLNKTLLKIDKGDVERIRVMHPAKYDDFILEQKGNGEFKLAGTHVPKGKKVKNYVAEGVAGAITPLSLDDVRKSDGKETEEIKFDHNYRTELKDGRIYNIASGEFSGRYWIRINVDYRPAKNEGDKKEGEPSEKKSPEEIAKTDRARFDGWIFEIDSYSAGNLRKKRSELFE